MIERKILILGPLAFLSFVLSFLAFAAIQPGYSHTLNMISELGMAGAPNASAWNWIGFGLTGLLALVFAWGLRATLLPERGATAVAILVAIAGAGWAALGLFPAASGFQPSVATTLHFSAVGVNYLAFLASCVVFAVSLRREPYWRSWVPFALAMAALGLASFFIPPSLLSPGLSQRLALLVYFVWLLGLGWAALRKPRAIAADKT
jgi:hypothetical membrane protein